MTRILAQVTFHCAVCGDAAATLTLTTSPSHPLTLYINGFMGDSFEHLSPDHQRALTQAIQQQSARAIYQMNSLWLPSYCPECQVHYCQQHWLLIPQFDDDFLGWYDCTYGFCPHQHKRLIDD